MAISIPNNESTDYRNLRTFFNPAKHGPPLIIQLLNHVDVNAPPNMAPLRISITRSEPEVLYVETTYFRKAYDIFPGSPVHIFKRKSHKALNVMHIVPTSVGASLGGFAGDASPATRLLSSVSEQIITNPNTVNASDILSISSNTLYVEGSFIDSFFLGQIALRPIHSNVVGIIIEKQPDRFINQVRYSIDAAHTTCGIPIAGYAVTKEKIRPRVRCFESGAYTGIIDNIDVMLEAAERLVSQGATAIAVTTEILDLPDLTLHIRGLAPNPHGGLEALISHTVSRRFGLPSAHAPMWGEFSGSIEQNFSKYDPRGAAELVTITAIGCVIQGLHKAPQAVSLQDALPSDLKAKDVVAVVLPAGAVGNIPSLASDEIGIEVIGVEGNSTIHEVSQEHLGLKNYIPVKNYLEAAGVVAALREGVAISSLLRPVTNIAEVL